MTAANCAPGLAARLTAAHDGSDAASRHPATSASAAPLTPASIATRMGPASGPHGPGGPVVLVGAAVVVAGATVVVGGAAVVLVVVDVVVAADVVVARVAESASVSSSRIARAAIDGRDHEHRREHRGEDPAPCHRRQSRVRDGTRRGAGAGAGVGAGYIPGISAQADLSADPTSDLELAHELADAADAIAMARFRAADLVVETKPDLTPVTEADRAVEEMIRARLADARPDDAVLGEEFGTTGDGARSAGAGSSTRSTAPRATPAASRCGRRSSRSRSTASSWPGWCRRPALGSRWSGGARAAAPARDGDAVSVSKVARDRGRAPRVRLGRRVRVGGTRRREFLALARRCWRVRGFGDFWAHMLVADGSIDIAVEVERPRGVGHRRGEGGGRAGRRALHRRARRRRAPTAAT